MFEGIVKKKKQITYSLLATILNSSDNLLFQTARFRDAMRDFRLKGRYTKDIQKFDTEKEIQAIKKRIDPSGELEIRV